MLAKYQGALEFISFAGSRHASRSHATIESAGKSQRVVIFDCGKLGAINIGTGMAKFWRIPVTERDKFLQRRDLP